MDNNYYKISGKKTPDHVYMIRQITQKILIQEIYFSFLGTKCASKGPTFLQHFIARSILF